MTNEMDFIQIISEPISREQLKEIAKKRFGDMVKVVVDLEKKIMAAGAELHADEEALLLEQGSRQQNLWGINIYVDMPFESMIEFDSMINIRPNQGNRSRSVEDITIQQQIITVVGSLFQE